MVARWTPTGGPSARPPHTRSVPGGLETRGERRHSGVVRCQMRQPGYQSHHLAIGFSKYTNFRNVRSSIGLERHFCVCAFLFLQILRRRSALERIAKTNDERFKIVGNIAVYNIKCNKFFQSRSFFLGRSKVNFYLRLNWYSTALCHCEKKIGMEFHVRLPEVFMHILAN